MTDDDLERVAEAAEAAYEAELKRGSEVAAKDPLCCVTELIKFSAMRAAIAAVAPIIRAAHAEEAAGICERESGKQRDASEGYRFGWDDACDRCMREIRREMGVSDD